MRRNIFKYCFGVFIVMCIFCIFLICSSANTLVVEDFFCNIDISYFRSGGWFTAYTMSNSFLPYTEGTSDSIPSSIYNPYTDGNFNTPFTSYLATDDSVWGLAPGSPTSNIFNVNSEALFTFSRSSLNFTLDDSPTVVIKFRLFVDSNTYLSNGSVIKPFTFPTDEGEDSFYITVNGQPVDYSIGSYFYSFVPVSVNGPVQTQNKAYDLTFAFSGESDIWRTTAYGRGLINDISFSFRLVDGDIPADADAMRFYLLASPFTIETSDLSVAELAESISKDIAAQTEALTGSINSAADKISDSVNNAVDDLTTPTPEASAIVGRTDDLSGQVDGYLDNGMNTIIVDLSQYAVLDSASLPLKEFRSLFDLFLNGHILVLFTTVLTIGFVLRLVFGSLPDLFAKIGNRENKRSDKNSKGDDG